jgi:hypothetical protein
MSGPKNATTTDRGRYYTWPPTGERFTSVTTLIGAGVPKPALLKWAPKMAAEFAVREWEHLHSLITSGHPTDKLRAIDDIKGAPWRDRDAAANKGTAVHDWAEKIALDPAYEAHVPEEIKGHVEQFRRFVDDLDVQFEATEFSVYSRTHGYAGTGDFIARFGARPDLGLVLGDYKTNRSGIFGDIALQLSALRFADFIGLPNNEEIEIPKIDTCVGVHITADQYKVIPVQVDEYIFQYFLRAMDIAKWQTEVSNYVLDKTGIAPVAS